MEHVLFIYITQMDSKADIRRKGRKMKKNKQIGTSHDKQNFNL